MQEWTVGHLVGEYSVLALFVLSWKHEFAREKEQTLCFFVNNLCKSWERDVDINR